MKLSYDIIEINDTAEWVIFLHGFGGNRKMWNKQLNSFKEKYNILNIDLPGHGNSEDIENNNDALTLTSDSIYGIVKELNIKKAHFVGVSLGTILAIFISMRYPEIVSDMILCGAIVEVNGFGGFLLNMANSLKRIIPYTWLYNIMACVLMPYKQSKKARTLFMKSAKRLGSRQFKFWFSALFSAKKLFLTYSDKIKEIPKVCIMGEYDKIFLRMLRKTKYKEYGFKIETIAKCGHVCNIENATAFNSIALSYLNSELCFTN